MDHALEDNTNMMAIEYDIDIEEMKLEPYDSEPFMATNAIKTEVNITNEDGKLTEPSLLPVKVENDDNINEEEFPVENEKYSCVRCTKVVDKVDGTLGSITFCGDCFSTIYEMKYSKFLEDTIGTCGYCLNGLVSGTPISSHDCTRANVYVCYFCDKRFVNKMSIEKHMKHRVSKYTCYNCVVSFCNRNMIKEHCKIMNNKDCSRSYKELTSTAKRQLSDKRHLCEFCVETFDTKSILTHTCLYKNNKICKRCKKPFLKLCHLQSHLNKKFLCNFKFIKPSILKYCLNIIKSKEIKYSAKCKGIQSVNSKRLYKSAKCTLCNSSFHNTHNLNRHMNIHANIRESCKICAKSFTRPDSLKRHVLERHSSKKQYLQCKFCDNKYTRIYNFKQHLKSVHKKQNKILTANESFKIKHLIKK